ncbi:hypothetical protein AVEN_216712-1 [Araneus ventricosus]|uniref:Uncharacterized protein n=1 Tax=Araneus ventricosus TaxID=182803 RepID=A0A4Y2VVA8_ARAVE|nr:hypothetical protein AVEN_216712-1 [Araneus ventricosus]
MFPGFPGKEKRKGNQKPYSERIYTCRISTFMARLTNGVVGYPDWLEIQIIDHVVPNLVGVFVLMTVFGIQHSKFACSGVLVNVQPYTSP